jgi:hypothetical protein
VSQIEKVKGPNVSILLLQFKCQNVASLSLVPGLYSVLGIAHSFWHLGQAFPMSILAQLTTVLLVFIPGI